MTDDRYICTKAAPWSPEKGRRSAHPDAAEIDTCYDGCCAIYECPNCGHEWQQELPQ